MSRHFKFIRKTMLSYIKVNFRRVWNTNFNSIGKTLCQTLSKQKEKLKSETLIRG